jgi:hypothetical protein
MAKKQYPIASKLIENSSRHCSTLAITESLVNGKFGLQIGHPDDKSRNGTLTFVTTNGKTFGITCWHVIEHLRELIKESGKDYSHSLYTMTPRPYIVIDRFIRPTSNTEYNQLDIAIRQVRADFVKALGKEPIDLDNQTEIDKIEFGYAVGFPEELKYIKNNNDPNKILISLPTVSILAEIERQPDSRFMLFSEFDEPQGYDTYSGMSGGPIFWSNSETYGIYGITYEANPTNFAGDKMGIMLAGELATTEVIKYWISQIEEQYEDKTNASS